MSIGVSYDAWQKDSHDSLPGVIFACGPETTLKDEFLEELQEQFPAEDREVLSLYGDEVDASDVLGELRGKGLFNEEKWIVLKRMGQSQRGGPPPLDRLYDSLCEYLEDREPGTLLVVQDADHPYAKGRKTGSFARAVESAGGWSIVFWPPFMNRLRSRFQKQFEQRDIDLHPEALQALMERSQGRFDRARQGAEKLLTSELSEITREDVERLVPRSRADSGFEAVEESLARGEPGETLEHVQDLWRQREAEPRVFAAVFRFFHQVRELRSLRRDRSLEDAMEELGLPDQKTVRKRFRRALKTLGGGFSRDFYRRAYHTARTAKYASRAVGQQAVETFILRMLPRLMHD